ncbi:MAG: hypothetical protein QME32_07465 [Endomicrobiia bacterium]|nr:hypothetical protein [Endomicrobiia bacterium]
MRDPINNLRLSINRCVVSAAFVAVFLFDARICRAEILLTKPPSARLAASEVFAAADGLPSSLLVNPAMMAVSDYSLETSVSRGFMGDDAYYYAGAVKNFQRKVDRNNFGDIRAGIFVGYYDGGPLEFYDSSGRARTVKAQSDYMAAAGISAVRGEGSVGAGVKIYSSRLADYASASAIAFDIGAIYRDPKSDFFMGIAVKNIGPSMKYITEEEKLPLTAACVVGAAGKSYTAGINIPYNARDGKLSPEAGVEAIIDGTFFLRGGYKSSAVEAFAVGFGLNLVARSLMLDYTMGINKIFENTHSISISYSPR